MKKHNRIVFALMLLMLSCVSDLAAQGFFVNADVVSNYIFRGRKFGNICLQPSFGYAAHGFTGKVWASTEFGKDENEIDLYVEYKYKGLTVSLQNVFFQPSGKSFDYFNYRKFETMHDFEAGIKYCLSERVPLTLAWYTKFAGSDYMMNHAPDNREFMGRQMYSTYVQLSYPFSVRDFDCSAEVGVTPWEGTYADRFAVNNVTFMVTRKINVAKNFSFSLFGQLTVNPFDNRAFFVGGLSI